MPTPHWPQVLGTSTQDPKTGRWTVALVTCTRYGAEVAEIGTGGREQDAKTNARAKLKRAVADSEREHQRKAAGLDRPKKRKKDTR